MSEVLEVLSKDMLLRSFVFQFNFCCCGKCPELKQLKGKENAYLPSIPGYNSLLQGV